MPHRFTRQGCSEQTPAVKAGLLPVHLAQHALQSIDDVYCCYRHDDCASARSNRYPRLESPHLLLRTANPFSACSRNPAQNSVHRLLLKTTSQVASTKHLSRHSSLAFVVIRRCKSTQQMHSHLSMANGCMPRGLQQCSSTATTMCNLLILSTCGAMRPLMPNW